MVPPNLIHVITFILLATSGNVYNVIDVCKAEGCNSTMGFFSHFLNCTNGTKSRNASQLWCREKYSNDALENIPLTAIKSLRATYFWKVDCEFGIDLLILMKLFDDLIDRTSILTKLLILKI